VQCNPNKLLSMYSHERMIVYSGTSLSIVFTIHHFSYLSSSIYTIVSVFIIMLFTSCCSTSV